MKENYDFFIFEIKQKSQLKELDSKFIIKYLDSYFLRRGDIRKKLESIKLTSKNKYVKEVVKDIRKEIGNVYGVYQTAQHKRKDKFLEEKNIEQLLLCHKSTRERQEFYTLIYNRILNWYTPEKIADIACGFNPVSYTILEDLAKKKFSYYVCDLNPEDMNFMNKFFDIYDLNGVAVALDVTQNEFLESEKFRGCDLLLLLKALDSFETYKKNSSKELLLNAPQKRIVVSFPTQSLVARKEVSSTKRTWFYKFLEEQKWNYSSFEIQNEMFFLIEK